MKRLTQHERQVIDKDIQKVEFGWPLGLPVCRALGDGLWEVRSDLPSQRIARVIFCIVDGQMILLHGFVKKTQKTPKRGLNMAPVDDRGAEGPKFAQMQAKRRGGGVENRF